MLVIAERPRSKFLLFSYHFVDVEIDLIIIMVFLLLPEFGPSNRFRLFGRHIGLWALGHEIRLGLREIHTQRILLPLRNDSN